MRKRTLKNIFIRLLRFTFLILPLLLSVVFTYTKLPLGTTSWDYDDGNYVIDGDSLSDRYSSWFLSTIYKPLSSMGLQNTFAYQGTSSLMSLLGFEPTVETVVTRSTTSLEAFDVGLIVDSVVFSATSNDFKNYIDYITQGGLNAPINVVSFTDGSRLIADSVAYKAGSGSTVSFSFYDSNSGVTTSLFHSTSYYNLTDNSFSIGGLTVSAVDSSYNSTYFSALVVVPDPEPDPEPVELTNPYVDFVALYLSYIIFVYLFEVFIRVLVWIPRWIIHYLDKPFLVVGEDDVD